MKYIFPFFLLLLAASPMASAQCKLIALDQVDEFDSTRVIATKPFNIGVLKPTGNVAENLKGQETVEEGKAIFSFGNEHNIRSFFLTLAVVERKFYMIEPDYNVYLKFVDGPVIKLLNVPEDAEFDRKILMWKYVHTAWCRWSISLCCGMGWWRKSASSTKISRKPSCWNPSSSRRCRRR